MVTTISRANLPELPKGLSYDSIIGLDGDKKTLSQADLDEARKVIAEQKGIRDNPKSTLKERENAEARLKMMEPVLAQLECAIANSADSALLHEIRPGIQFANFTVTCNNELLRAISLPKNNQCAAIERFVMPSFKPSATPTETTGVGGLGARGGERTMPTLSLAGLARPTNPAPIKLDFSENRANATQPPPQAGLSTSTVVRRMRREFDAIKYCYKKELSENPNLGGKVTINLTINPDGTVKDVSVQNNSNNDQEAFKRIAAGIKMLIENRLTFPPASNGEETLVAYPFIFKPSE